ncbi:MAG: hypothetical protein AAGI25_20465 [Bacteroidota bacterium]
MVVIPGLSEPIDENQLILDIHFNQEDISKIENAQAESLLYPETAEMNTVNLSKTSFLTRISRYAPLRRRCNIK